MTMPAAYPSYPSCMAAAPAGNGALRRRHYRRRNHADNPRRSDKLSSEGRAEWNAAISEFEKIGEP
jgi:hypothetical protein